MCKKAVLTATLCFTIIYTSIFSFLALKQKNYEFLYYAALIFIALAILIKYSKKLNVNENTILGLSLTGLIGLLGGAVYINGTRLMDVKFGIIEYDNILHFFIIFAATFALYDLLKNRINYKIKNKPLLLLTLTLMAAGIGTIIEILELIVVLYFPSNGVGDYLNNAFDLVFNLLGTITACVIIWLKR